MLRPMPHTGVWNNCLLNTQTLDLHAKCRPPRAKRLAATGQGHCDQPTNPIVKH